MQRTRLYLKSKFKTGDIPTGTNYPDPNNRDFEDLFDSYVHKTEDPFMTSVNGFTPNVSGAVFMTVPAMEKTITQSLHGFTVGKLVYHDGTSYKLASASAEAPSRVIGIISSVTDLNNFTLITGGYINGLSGLVPGQVYYLSASTPGTWTLVPSTSPTAVVRAVFVADTTTSGYFNNFNLPRHRLFNHGSLLTDKLNLNFTGPGVIVSNSTSGTDVTILFDPAVSGNATWGEIGGTLSLQTDLTSYISSAVSSVINGAPSNLDTLKELAQAINNDPVFSSTVTGALATKAPINNPFFTGVASGNYYGSFVGNLTGTATSATNANFATSASSANYSQNSSYATLATSALSASKAVSANYATNATECTIAVSALYLTGPANFANYATEAGSAAVAGSALTANSATNADEAVFANSANSIRTNIIQNNLFASGQVVYFNPSLSSDNWEVASASGIGYDPKILGVVVETTGLDFDLSTGYINSFPASSFNTGELYYIGYDGYLTNIKPSGNNEYPLPVFVADTDYSGMFINSFIRDLPGFRNNIKTISAGPYTPSVTDYTLCVSGDTSIILPAASAAIGIVYNVKKIDAAGTTTTISSADFIDGLTSQTITTQYSTFTIQSDGTTWWIL